MAKLFRRLAFSGGAFLSFLLLAGSASAAGSFSIVGMGTAPDLITVRGLECVNQADIVILEEKADQEAWKDLIGGKEVWFLGHASQIFYGVHPKSLKDAADREKAQRFDRARRAMMEKITKAVGNGKNVASLQWGDPMMYGITYYLEMLPKEIPSEIIPGVGAFQASSAAVKMSPPYGWDTNSVILTMADWPGRSDTNEKLMATKTSMVFYTMHLDYPELFGQLKRHYPHDTPAAVVNFAGDRQMQKVIYSTVGKFLKEVNYSELPPEAHMLLVGKFLKVGQARKEGLTHGENYIRERHGEVGIDKK